MKTGLIRSIQKKYFPTLWAQKDRVLVLSYPKSGRTWLHTMLDDLGIFARYDHAEANAVHNPDKPFIPDTYYASEILTDKNILLLRDPRDIIVSNYFESTRRQGIFNGSISAFIRHQEFGMEALLRFQHKWLRCALQYPDSCMVESYEHLLGNGVSALDSITSFILEQRVSRKKLASTMHAFCFSSMKRMEKKGVLRMFYGKKLKAGDAQDTDSFKVRKGRAGGFTEYLSNEDIEYCNERMKRMGSLYCVSLHHEQASPPSRS
jgi:hypothetical protein